MRLLFDERWLFGLDHAAFPLEMGGDVLTSVGEPGDCFGGDRFGGFSSFLQINKSPLGRLWAGSRLGLRRCIIRSPSVAQEPRE